MNSFEDATKERIFSQFALHAFPPSSEQLSSTFILPHTHWNSGDKESFFDSLARHSRWRPDMIAEDIGGGKSTADVCSYIELLEQVSARGVRKDQRLRDQLPCAREVSEDWIGMEESMAKLLRQEEEKYQDAAAKRKRRKALKEAKAVLRREEEGVEQDTSEDEQELAADPKRKRRSSELEQGEHWRERYETRKRELTIMWKREKLLSSLEGRYLKTLESMVRDLDEEGGNDDLGDDTLQRTRGASVVATGLPAEFGSSGSNLMVSPGLNRSNMTTVDNSRIDPLLLALDAESHPILVASSSSRPPQDVQSHNLPTPLAHTSPGPSGRQPAHSIASTLLPNQPNAPPLILPSELSPASRRRIRKRLWMRQKRAALNGLPASDVSADIRKLKPGRKGASAALKGKGKAEEFSTCQDSEVRTRGDQATDSDDRSIADGDASGKTRIKKLYGSSKFKAVEVDAPFLRTAGLDLFHLAKFGGIANLLRDIYRHPADRGDDSDAEAALSYSILRLLRAHVADFVTRLLARVIAQKHVEAQQKKRIRSILHTGGSMEVRAENVHEALKIMGEEITHKRFFKQLKATARSADSSREVESRHNKSAAVLDSDDDSETTDGSGSSSEAGDDHHADFSSHALPLTLTPQPPSCSFWNPEVLLSHGKNPDALLPAHTDEDALRKELKAERKAEDADQDADADYERALWTDLGIERDVGGTSRRARGREHAAAGAKPDQSLRFRQPGGYVKSRVYIDSDEDESKSLVREDK